MRDSFKDFESPFLDPGLLMRVAGEELHGHPADLWRESPFDRLSIDLEDADAAESEVFETRRVVGANSNYAEMSGESGGTGLDELEEEDSERWNEAGFDTLAEEQAAFPEEGQEGEIHSETDEELDDEFSLSEECDSQHEEEVEIEQEDPLDPPDTMDQAAAQPRFPKAVRDRIEPLLAVSAVAAAAKWNREHHPKKSGIGLQTLRASLDSYLDSASIEQAMRNSPELRGLVSDSEAVFAVLIHQFQQKIYKSLPKQLGHAGEGTLDALGFVRHRDDSLNRMDLISRRFHAGTDGKSKSKAFKRIEEAYKKAPGIFVSLGTDVSPRTWYSLFVYAPFLGRPILNGVHVELMRRLRLAEKWLLTQRQYQNMSPVELGVALGIDEDHHGGRTKNNASMHTLGLAIDVGYIKNPWVAGQSDAPTRNSYFQAVTRNASRLLSGTEETVTPNWLFALGSDPGRTTESAHREIQKCHTQLQVYLSLQNDPDGLKTTIQRRSHGLNPGLVIGPGESIDAAVRRWAETIKSDRGKLQHAFGSGRKPVNGFLNFHSDLAVALRDHGCLAWGAIDLGGQQSGDMMHFDCRATGIGWTLALDSQRTVGGGHPCGSKRDGAATAAPSRPVAPAGALSGQDWTFNARTLPMRVAVYCPRAARSLDEIEMLVFLHGLLGSCPPVPKVPEDLVTKRPFELGRIVDASRRGVVLVVPHLDWFNLDKNGLGFGPLSQKTEKPIYHALGKPANLNGIVREVMAEISRDRGRTISLSRLILAGHSRAYGVLDPLARAHADTEMTRLDGGLSKLSHIWALDTTYSAPIKDWIQWLQAKPSLEVQVFYRPQGIVRTKGSDKSRVVDAPTKAGGLAFEGAVKSVGKRLRVTRVSAPENHCDVPAKRLPGLLAGLP